MEGESQGDSKGQASVSAISHGSGVPGVRGGSAWHTMAQAISVGPAQRGTREIRV